MKSNKFLFVYIFNCTWQTHIVFLCNLTQIIPIYYKYYYLIKKIDYAGVNRQKSIIIQDN